MSIATEITRLQNAKTSIKTSIENKGVTVPSATKLDGYSTLIDSIQTGIIPTGTISITTNGIVDVTNYASADVNVSGGDSHEIEDALLSGTLSGAYTNPRITEVGQYGFAGKKKITSLSLPNVIKIDIYAFSNMTNLETINLPNLQNTSFVASTYNQNIFSSDAKLRVLIFPKIQTYVGGSFFSSCSALETLDFGAEFLGFNGSSIFSLCGSLRTIILRRNAISSISNANVLNATPFKANGAGGTLYVPQALISSYQSATNWSTILSRETNQILPIEGSIYETQYADGTPIGA